VKFLFSLLIGLLTGVLLFTAGMVYNPFVSKQALSPLSVTDSQTVTLGYSGVASKSLVYTNSGQSREGFSSKANPYPEKVQELWEAPIRKTSVMATVLWDGRNQATGIGIKVSSASERTRLLKGEALVDSIWYVYLPGRGSLFIEQTENYWDYLRQIVLPAYRSSANTWTGTWLGNVTSGPGSLGTAKVTGGSGDFNGLDMLAVETLSVRVWRLDDGPVAAEGRLIVELPANPDTAELAVEPTEAAEEQL